MECLKCWCGEEATVHKSQYSFRFHVSCSKDNDHVPWYDGFCRNGGFDTEREAIEDWNTRMKKLSANDDLKGG